MELFINILLVVTIAASLCFDFAARKKNADQIEVIQAKLQYLLPCDSPKSHVLLSPPKFDYIQDGTRFSDKMRETLIRMKHDAKRKSLMTPEDIKVEALKAEIIYSGAARKKEVQRLIKLIADDFFIDVKEDGDAEATRFSASLFGTHLISVLEGKESDVKETYKPFPRGRAAEIKTIVDRWVNDGCPY